MIEPYVRPEFEEFSGGIKFRLVYDAIGEALQEIDRQLEVVGPVAFEIAMKSRGYVKERTCTVEKFQQNPSYGDYYCELSCGCWFDVVDDRPPAYCLICGAKVVSE